jgi:uncharacterized membrane protein
MGQRSPAPGEAVDNFLHITALWLHVLGIALFVGPQFFLAFAWVPASRGIADMPTRIQAMRTITRRFGYIGGIGLGLIVIAGTYMISTWRDFYGYPDDAGFLDVRYGVIFTIKMGVLAVMLIAVGVHMFYLGPKLVDRLEAEANGEAVDAGALRRLRMWSMTLSISGLLLTLIIMAMGVSLSTANFSLKAV